MNGHVPNWMAQKTQIGRFTKVGGPEQIKWTARKEKTVHFNALIFLTVNFHTPRPSAFLILDRPLLHFDFFGASTFRQMTVRIDP